MPAATVQPLQAAGILFTVALIALAWAGRGRLNSFGLEFVHWNRTSSRVSLEALCFGAVCGLAASLLFQALYKGTPFEWQDALIGITLGPLIEETVFRGYLFGLAEWALQKQAPNAYVDRGNRNRSGVRVMSPAEGRHHGLTNRSHLRHGRCLRLVTDQVEFDDCPFPGACCV